MWEDDAGKIHFSDQPRHEGFKWLEGSDQRGRERRA